MESSIQAFTSSDSTSTSGSDGNEPALSMENTEEFHSYEVSEKPLNPPIQSIDSNSSSCPENNERKQSFGTDNASMTIDFLRARLLSERSISKSAKERAKHLAKKVIELESMLEAELNRRKLSQAAVEKALVELQSAGLQEQSAHIDFIIKQAHDEKQKEEKKDDLVAPTKASNEDSGIERANSKRYSESSFQQKNDLTFFEHNQKLERGCDSRGLDLQSEGSSVVESTVDEVVADDISENTNTSALAVSPSHCSKQTSHMNPVRKIGRSCRVFKTKSIDLTETSTIFKVEVPSDQNKGKSIAIGSDFSAKDSQFIEMNEENSGFKEHDLTGNEKGEAAGSVSSHEDHFFQKGDFINSCSELTDEENVKLGLGLNDIHVNGKLEGQNCQSQQCNRMTEEGVSSKLDTRSHDVDIRIGLADEYASYEVHDAEKRVNTDSKNILQHYAKSCSHDKVFEDAKLTTTKQQHSETALLRCHSKKAQHDANSESLSKFKILLQDGGSWGPETDADTGNQQPLNGSLHGLVSLQTESQHIVSMETIALQTSSYQNKPCFPSDVSNKSDQQICPGDSRESPVIGVIVESSGGNQSIQQCNQCMSQIQCQGNNLGDSPRCSSLNQRSGLKRDEEEILKNILGKSRSSCNIFAAEELEEMNQDSSDAYRGAGFISSQNIKPCNAKAVFHGSNDSTQGSNHFDCGHIQDARADNASFDVRQKRNEFINCSCGKSVDDNSYQKMERNISNRESKMQAFRNNLHVKVTNNVGLDSESPSSIGSQSESPPETLADKKMERHDCCTSHNQFNADVSYKKAGLQRSKNWSQDQLGCACVHVLDDDKRYRQADNRTSCHRPRKCGKSIKARASFTRSELCASHVHGCTQVPEFTSVGKNLQSHNLHDMVVDNDIGNIASCSDSFLNTSVLELGTNKCKTSKCLESGFLCRNIDSGHPDYPYGMPPNWNRNEKDLEITSNENCKILRVLPPEARPYDAYPAEARQNIDMAYSERHRSLSSQFPYKSRIDNNRETKNWTAFRSTEPSQALLPATAYMGRSRELNSLKGNENLHTVLAALKLAKEHMKSSSDQRQLSSSYADAVQYNLPFTYGTRNYCQRSFGYPSERAHLDLLSTREAHALHEREYHHRNKNSYEYRNNFAWDRINSIASRQEYPWYHFIEQLPEFSYVERLNVGKGIEFFPN